MVDHDPVLRQGESDHTNLDIPVYKKEDDPPLAPDPFITPHLVMVMDRLTDRAIDCWLEWVDPHTHLCFKQERDRSLIMDFMLGKWKAPAHPPAKPRRRQRKVDQSSSPPTHP